MDRRQWGGQEVGKGREHLGLVPVGCPTIQLSSDTVYPEVASDSEKGLSPTKPPSTSDANRVPMARFSQPPSLVWLIY